MPTLAQKLKNIITFKAATAKKGCSKHRWVHVSPQSLPCLQDMAPRGNLTGHPKPSPSASMQSWALCKAVGPMALSTCPEVWLMQVLGHVVPPGGLWVAVSDCTGGSKGTPAGLKTGLLGTYTRAVQTPLCGECPGLPCFLTVPLALRRRPTEAPASSTPSLHAASARPPPGLPPPGLSSG